MGQPFGLNIKIKKKIFSNTDLTFDWQSLMPSTETGFTGDQMTGFETHYIYCGLAVLIGSVAFMKAFDFLAYQNVKRLLNAANRGQMK